MAPIGLPDVLAPLDGGVTALFVVPIALLALTRLLFALIDAANLRGGPPGAARDPKRRPYAPADVSVICVIEAGADLADFQAAVLSWQASQVACAVVVVSASSANYRMALAALSRLTRLPYRLLVATDDDRALIQA